MNPLTAIGHNLRHVFSFSGRQSRSRFWPYAICIFILAMAGGMAVMLPEMAGAFQRMQRFAAEHPDQATVTRGPGSYSISIHGNHPELMPDIGVMISGFSVVLGVAVVLLAAAVARRLHDRGKSGIWGLIPVPFIVVAFVVMPKIFSDPEMHLGLFFAMFINNALYLASLVFLVVLLAGESTEGANRYGLKPEL